jgi:uncharacterized protein (TIRG00374 family)
MKKYKLIMLVLSFLLLGVVISYFNPFVIAGLLAQSNPVYILLALLLSVASLSFGVLKWKILLKNVSFRTLYPVQVLGFTISNFTPGKAAEPAKAVILKMRTDIAISFSLASIIWERILDVVVLVAFSLVAITTITMSADFFLPIVLGIGIFVALVCLSLLVLYSEKFGRKIFSLLKKLPLFKRLPENFMDLFYSQQMSKGRVVKAFFSTLIAWTFNGLTLYAVLLAFGVQVNMLTAIGVVALSVVVGIASSLPGGLGTTEIIMIFMLGALGINSATAAAATLTFRLMTIWFVNLLGGVSFLYLSRKIELKNVFR